MAGKMRQVRGRRRWLAGLIGLAAALAVVLSVTATGAVTALEASTQGVTPAVVNLGGQSFDCPAVQSTGTYEYRIVTPKTASYTDPATGARFNLTVTNGDSTLAFSMTGGAVEDVVVKGGTNSSHYDYMAGGPKKPITSDGNLHAPPKGSNFYSVSQTTFCYDTLAKIGGNVWRDSNENKAKDTFESYQQSWGIDLYQGSSTTPYRSTTTDGSGHYEFTGVPIGSQYTVCEKKPSGDSGSWGQSTPTTAVCSSLGSGEPNGYQFQLTGDTLDKNFGNLNTVSLTCGTSTGPVSTPDDSYTVKFGGSGFCTKAGAQEYVFEAYTNPDQVKNFHPDGTGTGNGEYVYLVERLSWTIAAPTGVAGVSQGSVLKYDDVLSDGISPKPMLYCLKDPRLPVASGAYAEWDITTATGVLPTGETSCLIKSTVSTSDTSTTPPSVSRLDYVFSSVDGVRTLG